MGNEGLPHPLPVLNSPVIMKFKVNRNHFFNGLSSVTNVVGNRATMPILQNVLIEAEGDTITLTTTNLDLGICCRIKASVSSPGRITLPVKKLVPIIRALSSSDTIVELTGKDRVKITSGSSVFQIAGLPADQFPPISNFTGQPTMSINQDDLGDMLRKVSYAQSSDENRYILNGVFFEFAEGKLTVVATDGRRLAKCERKIAGSDKALALILPARTIIELMRLLKSGGEAHVSHNERQVGFTIDIPKNEEGLVDRIQLVSKVVEGNYPNYRQVIPKEAGSKVRLEREKLLESVNRAALMTLAIAVVTEPVWTLSEPALQVALRRIVAEPLSAQGDISRCSVTSYANGKPVEGFQCRIAGYIPRPAPGRKPGVTPKG